MKRQGGTHRPCAWSKFKVLACITNGFPICLWTWWEAFQHSLQLFNNVKWIFLPLIWSKPKAVDIDYSCLWIVLLAERISCVLQMKDLIWFRRFVSNINSRPSKNTLLSKHWTTHARQASGCAVLLLTGEAMINIFQLVREHVLCSTTHLC